MTMTKHELTMKALQYGVPSHCADGLAGYLTGKYEAAHSCGKGAEGCVNPKHLRWATRSENQADRVMHGTDSRGEKCGKAKLTEKDVREIRALKGRKLQREIAKQFGVSQSQVSRIHHRENWNSVI